MPYNQKSSVFKPWAWFKERLTLILGVLAILSTLAAIAGWSKDTLVSYVTIQQANAQTEARIERTDQKLNKVDDRVVALEHAATQNSVEHATITTQLPMLRDQIGDLTTEIRSQIKDLKKDIRTFSSRGAP